METTLIWLIGPALAGLIILTVFRQTRKAREARLRLEATGIRGEATIQQLAQYGTAGSGSQQFILYNLHLEVKTSTGRIYPAVVKWTVPLLQAFRYEPGYTVPVLIDAQNDQEVVLDEKTLAAPLAAFAPPTVDEATVLAEIIQWEADYVRLVAAGAVTAPAVILTARSLGVHVNGNNPYTEFELQVLPATAPAFAAKTRVVIGAPAVNKYVAGHTIAVIYDPAQPGRVLFSKDQPKGHTVLSS